MRADLLTPLFSQEDRLQPRLNMQRMLWNPSTVVRTSGLALLT